MKDRRLLIWNRNKSKRQVRDGLTELYPRLHRYCLVLAADRATADDLAQMACLRALERAEQFKPGSSLDLWLFRLTQRVWIDELRKQAVRKGGGLFSLSEVNLADQSPDPESRAINQDVIRGVMQLPEAQRATVLLVYGEGYKYKDAAEILDIPVGTVMSRLAAARGQLVMRFEDQAGVG
ncbi:MAG: RNA polymerase sigma factor [Pseudomonadota bacterium]